MPWLLKGSRAAALAGSWVLALCTGCAILEPWVEFPAAKPQPARILWQRQDHEQLVMDAVFLRAPGSSGQADAWAVVVGKGQSLLEVQWREGQVQARGAFPGGRWSGPVEKAPPALADWAWLLSAWAAATAAQDDGRLEIHTAAYRAAWHRQRGTLRELLLQPNGRPSRFVVQFFPTS